MADKYGIQMNLLGQMWIETSGRKMRLEYGDYIITNTEGKYKVVDGKTFVSTYKDAEELSAEWRMLQEDNDTLRFVLDQYRRHGD